MRRTAPVTAVFQRGYSSEFRPLARARIRDYQLSPGLWVCAPIISNPHCSTYWESFLVLGVMYLTKDSYSKLF